jgi:hypothetical protein
MDTKIGANVNRVITPEEIRFRLQKYTAKGVLTEELLRNINIESFLDSFMANLVIEVSQIVPYRDGDPIRVPSTWWDAFKEKWFPAWALARWPAKFRAYQARAFYPNLPLPNTKIGTEYVMWIPKGPIEVSVRDANSI